MTLNCVSNEVGGDLIGNAWWSGVRLAPILEEAGILPGRRRGPADLRRRLDLRHPAGRPDRRPQRDAGAGDERPTAADRPRLPGAHAGARALRLRLGHQVGPRDGGVDVRRHLGLLDRARLGRARPGEDVVAGRRAALRRGGGRGRGRVRRRRLVAAHRHLRRRVLGRRRRLGVRRPRAWSPTRTPGCSGPARPRSTPATTWSGCGRPTRDGTVQTSVEQGVLPDGATGLHARDFTAS